MKTIIQKLSDRAYLGEGFSWVQERENAKFFPGSVEALEFCLQHDINGVELVMMNEQGTEIVRVVRG